MFTADDVRSDANKGASNEDGKQARAKEIPLQFSPTRKIRFI